MAEKLDTTTWMLILLLVFLWLRKQSASTAQQQSAAGGLTFLPQGAAAAQKPSILQQLLNPQKPSAGTPATIGSGGLTGGTSRPPTPGAPIPTHAPLSTRQPVATIPSVLTSLIPSIPPPVYQLPDMPYGGQLPLATVPSDTSNIFITPDEPPSYEAPTMNYPGPETGVSVTIYDPYTGQTIPTDTSFSPVDTQTIDTSNLGDIAYLPPPDYGDLGGGGSGGDMGTFDYTDMAMSD